MSWDARKMASDFLMKANAVRPEDADNRKERSGLLATQEIFYECYMNSFSREKVLEFLNLMSSDGKVEIPEDVDEQEYTTAFRSTAARVLREMTR